MSTKDKKLDVKVEELKAATVAKEEAKAERKGPYILMLHRMDKAKKSIKSYLKHKRKMARFEKPIEKTV